jgi:hypothetical protein
MADREFYDRDRNRSRDWEDRSRERDRGDRWEDRQRSGSQLGSSGDWANNRREEQTNRGGEWGRESRQENWDRSQQAQRHDQFIRGDEPERWRDHGSSYREGRGVTENYQRGGSGSEAGYGSERSHGTPRGFGERGGGTGIRDDEAWGERNRERGGSREYRSGGYSDAGYATGWGGGLSGYTGSFGTYMDRAQQGQGRFVGRGPKGWRRSDERIREDVNERLTMHPDIDASDIDVQVRECEVTLSGFVDDRHAKRLAEEVVENISGVKEVNNQIRVRRTEDRGRDQSSRDQRGLGSGFDTSTGNRGENPLGLNQPQGQQRSGQQTGQQQGSHQYGNQQYGGQQTGAQQHQQTNQPQQQYTNAGQNRTNR